jgi:hypothetical protein
MTARLVAAAVIATSVVGVAAAATEATYRCLTRNGSQVCTWDVRATIEHRASKPGELTWVSTSTWTVRNVKLKTTHIEIVDRPDLPDSQSPDTFVTSGKAKGQVSRRIQVNSPDCVVTRTDRVGGVVNVSASADLEDQRGKQYVFFGVGLSAKSWATDQCASAENNARVESTRATSQGVRTTLGAGYGGASFSRDYGDHPRPLGRLWFPLDKLVAGRPFEIDARVSQPQYSRSAHVHIRFTPRKG